MYFLLSTPPKTLRAPPKPACDATSTSVNPRLEARFPTRVAEWFGRPAVRLSVAAGNNNPVRNSAGTNAPPRPSNCRNSRRDLPCLLGILLGLLFIVTKHHGIRAGS